MRLLNTKTFHGNYLLAISRRSVRRDEVLKLIFLST